VRKGLAELFVQVVEDRREREGAGSKVQKLTITQKRRKFVISVRQLLG
jgi:hypothetical protein